MGGIISDFFILQNFQYYLQKNLLVGIISLKVEVMAIKKSCW